MNRFAFLLDRLAYEPRRNAKIRLMAEYFRETPDPERGFALAALTGALSFRHAKPGLIRGLIMERTDPVLFGLSYDYVGDLAETVALMWPGETRANRSPLLSEIVEGLTSTAKLDLPKRLAQWLDALDETGRWALLKLITGSLRIGASARLAKTAVAALGEDVKPDDVELVWPGLAPPYEDLFAWVEGRGERPFAEDPAPFRPPMLAHPLEDANFRAFEPKDFVAEWKWDGIRVQASAGRDAEGRHVARLWSRSGEDVSGAFPDLVEALTFDGAIDGELLILREGRVQTFNVLQQRLNRKSVTPKLLAEFPAHIRAYDLLVEGDEDLRERPFEERRKRLEAFIAREDNRRVDLSAIVPFDDWDGLTAARLDPASAGAGDDAAAVEGLMVKRRDSPYVVGRPKGLWFKWKHDPMTVDAVLMYAQRGHGRRSSFYSDYTFGVWTTDPEEGERLAPVGKAYFGFTDEELTELDRFVRKNTTNRFGPVREVVHTAEQGLVLEIAFEGIARSTRHKSGVAMRFPRVARIRWDKPTAEADRLESLEALIAEKEGA
ncbi:cisplatin damage response ATP-dependent DNA ligase [Hansschlegelia zhihuaiae]|uniref:DNA ligase (ATP) n=1 Tax=Hansschlegelia zhihuaiae TaxID=405005 RepID=A0A4Q0MQU8_9HYPH|nr:cisplatin damage response ATP-dependent DNA ligase [Hansschlegelia zhihuaiae]RXF75516.1 cisplatin damage response ATP-dependent DNA ligase [Hansschlegelia zhihuaiae]